LSDRFVTIRYSQVENWRPSGTPAAAARSDERLLHRVLGVAVPGEQPQGGPEHRPLVPPEQQLERTAVTAPRAFDEFVVSQVRQRIVPQLGAAWPGRDQGESPIEMGVRNQ
jgi:hypothetical protein